MKKVLAVLMGIILFAGCSKKSQYTNDLAGTWTVYKVTLNNSPDGNATDSFSHYSITFTSGGQYAEFDTLAASGPTATGDTIARSGAWQFQNSYGQLVLTDSAAAGVPASTTYTIFDLTGSSVELLNDGYTRYMRKNP
jgi:hypothetical protein